MGCKHISTAFAWIREVNPSSVLDVGVEFGRWGQLCCEHLDVRHDSHGEKDRRPRLVCIEGFEPMHPDFRYMYDDILTGDALERIHDVGLFDLVVIGDALERFTRVQSDCMLVNASAIAKAVLIVTTGSERSQGAMHGDGRERLHAVTKFRHVRGMFRVFRHQMFENGGRGWMALIEGQRARAGEGTP